MAGEFAGHQGAGRHRGRPLLRLIEGGDDLGAALLDHVGVEARLGERQPQQLEALVAVGRQDAQAAAQAIERGAEGERCGGVLLALAEGMGGERPRAIGEQRRHKVADARLAGRIGGRAAGERKGDGQGRRALVLHQPGFYAERRGQRLDVDRARGGRQPKDGDDERAQKQAHRLPTCGVNTEVTRRSGRQM